MDNNRFPLRKVVAVTALALAISGCSEQIEDAVSDNNHDSFAVVSAPVGDISGIVQDTNGNPVAGATVYVGNKSTTTNAGGIYYFEDVKVTQTKAREDSEGTVYQQAVSVSIVPPAGYLGATVTVWPQSQIFETTTGAANETVENPNVVFVDGFVAEAGAAVLPALTAELSGVARDSATGEPLANATVALDMVATLAINGAIDSADPSAAIGFQQQSANGVAYSYATAEYTAVTDADGNFTFTNLPADSAFFASISGYQVVAWDVVADEEIPMIATLSESGNSGIELLAAEFISVDDINPIVVQVAEVVNQNSVTGNLNDDFTTVLTLKFSELLNTSKIDSNSVIVRNIDTESYYGVQVTVVSGNEVTITLDSTVAAGTELDVFLLKDDFVDLAGNALQTGDKVGFDSDRMSATNADYIELSLVAFKETNLEATAVNLSGSQVQKDLNGVNNFALEDANYDSFNDVYDDGLSVQGINSADDDDGNATADADERLTALGAALLSAAEYSAAGFAVESTVARLEFLPSNATSFAIEVTRDNQPVMGFPILEVVNGDFDDTVAGRLVAHDTSANVEVVLSAVQEGDIVTITPYDDFDFSGTSNSVKLVDNVAPTPVLQKAYGSSASDNLDAATGSFEATYGAGGEVSFAGSGEVLGYPILNISPNLLALRDGTVDGVSDNGIAEYVDLLSYNSTNTSGSETFGGAQPGEQFIQESLSAAGSALQVYDATAYAAYVAGADRARTVGVAMSEDIKAIADPVYAPVDVTVSNWQVLNDVIADDDGDVVNVDLMTFDVNDVLTWSLKNSESEIDFTAAITDLADNSASAQAKVVVKDAIPPFVASAVYSGANLTITFNEAVDLSDSPVITLDSLAGTDVNLTLDLSSDHISQPASNQVVIAPGAWGNDINVANVFDLARYSEVDPSADPSGANIYRHAVLAYAQVEDTNGNSWSDYASIDEADFAGHPQFAVINTAPDFNVTAANVQSGFSAGAVDGTFVIQWDFQHPIDLTDLGAANPTQMTAIEVDNAFETPTNTLGWTIDVSGTSTTTAALTANGTRLTVTVDFNGTLSSGDTFRPGPGNVPSSWDSSVSIPVPNAQVQ